jgi:hypothetical protein
VHKYTFKNHPGALKEGRIFDCETDVVVCSRVHGMGLAYSLDEAHVRDHCERVGANPGMEMRLPFNLLSTSKDKDLLSIVPRAFPELGLDTSSTGELGEYGRAMFGKKFGEDGSGGSRNDGSDTESKTDSEEDPKKVLRIAAAADGGPGKDVDYGGGSAAPQKAKKSSKDRRKPKRRPLGGGGRNSSKEMFGQLTFAPLGDSLTLEVFVAPSTVELRRVFSTTVCVKMFGEELGPGNEPCEG